MGQKFSLIKCTYGKYVIPQQAVTVCILTAMSILVYMTKCIADELFLEMQKNISEYSDLRKATGCNEAITLNNTVLDGVARGQTKFFILLSSTYMFGSIGGLFVAGVFADLFGGRHVLLVGFLGKVLMSFSLPSIILYTNEKAKIIIGFVGGFFEGFAIATAYNILAHWASPRYLTVATTLVFNGPTTATMLVTILKSYYEVNLQVLLYIVGILESLIYLTCVYFIFSRPVTHPSISPQEKANYMDLFPKNELPGSIPWTAILTDFNVWALCACNIGYNWQILVLRYQLRTYFNYVLFVDMANIKQKFDVSIKATTIFTSIILAFLADYNIKKDYIPIVYLRSTYLGVALIVANAFAVAILFVGCNIIAADVFLWINEILASALNASLRANTLDNTRHYTGTVIAITCGGGHFVRGLLWIIFGYAIKNQSYAEWFKALWLNFAICTFCAVVHFDGSRGQRAPWDIIKPREDKHRMTDTNIIL